MKGHGLLQRVGKPYAYRLTPKPGRVAARFVRFHQPFCRPLAHSWFHHQPTRHPKAPAKLKPHTTELMPLFKISLICWLPE